MGLLFQLLWAVMLLLFFAGCLAYAFSPHLGLGLFKKAAVLLVIVLIGPSLLNAAIAEIPLWVLILLLAGASIGAYHWLTQHGAKAVKQGHVPGASHAERHPHLPQEEGGDE
jgi:hypothetical protein